MTEKDRDNVQSANDGWSDKSTHVNKQQPELLEKAAGGKIQYMAKPDVASAPTPPTAPATAATDNAKKD
ncbi:MULTISPECIES: hypothetical protein [unclassified Rhizobium]|uniref:hypothetical protein n=1 Tax=unclassified Rhizobium TaxID=2613769 RepID=UPI00288A1E8F|nr:MULTISPECIES: hypothetical protein [unclassified Rhizobium]